MNYKDPVPCSVFGCQSVARKGKLCVYHASIRAGAKAGERPKRSRRKPLPAGYFRTGNGYVMQYVAPGTHGARPYGAEGRWGMLQHRAVMMQIIGRGLLPAETVHHINGVRDDNRPENLELWVSSHPSGQRVADQLKWAREIVETYGDAN